MHAHLSLYRFDQMLLPAFADSLLPATSLKLTKHLNRQRGMSADFYACETPPGQRVHYNNRRPPCVWFTQCRQSPHATRNSFNCEPYRLGCAPAAKWPSQTKNQMPSIISTSLVRRISILVFPIFVRRLMSWWRTATSIGVQCKAKLPLVASIFVQILHPLVCVSFGISYAEIHR